jgi:uncharacterized membrane protein YphA (DoxX/SURF4 family)
MWKNKVPDGILQFCETNGLYFAIQDRKNGPNQVVIVSALSPFPNHSRRNTFNTEVITMSRFLAFVLGILFFAAGISKLFVLEAFAATIAGIIHAPIHIAFSLAVGIICLEAGGAIALLTDFKTRTVSILFCAVVGVFIWVLVSAILQGKEITCHCFGILGISLTNRQELMLDVLLFNAFGLLGYLSPVDDRALFRRNPRWGRVSTAALALILGLLECGLLVSLLDGGRVLAELHPEQAILFAERADSGFANQSKGNRILFVIRLADLQCPLCCDDFLRLADSVHARMGDNAGRALALFERVVSERNDSLSQIQQWVNMKRFQIPAIEAPDSVIKALHLRKSLALIIDPGNKVVLSERFPMGLAKQLTALQLLRL